MTAAREPFSPDAAALFALPPEAVEEIRADCAGRHFLPYDQLDDRPHTASPRFAIKVDAMLETGWRWGGLTTDLGAPIPWDGHSRSYRFHIHAWEPLTILLPGYQFSGCARILQACARFAEEWLELFQARFLGAPLTTGIAEALALTDTMAWYDMSVGQRCYRLAYLADLAARRPELRALFAPLFRSLVFHQEMLARDDFWVAHNNHGLYQALGQLAAARRFGHLPGFAAYRRQAHVRLADILERQFFPEGTHREHSPDYHRMVLGSVTGAVSGGLVEDAGLRRTLARAVEALGWMAMPDGSLVPFGDTDHRPGFVAAEAVAHLRDPATVAALTGAGRVPPRTGVRAYAEAGYVFARFLHPHAPTSATASEASYLAQQAGFHSRTHKHADHLAFVWSDRGTRILVDPGRYGYGDRTVLGDPLSAAGFYYSDPDRIYVERTRAHNCVEIDGTDHPRRKVRPFGSALRFAGETNGLAVTFCEARYPLRHLRTLILAPRHFLLVLDWLGDRTGGEHVFRQWFQMSPEWEAERVEEADAVRARAGELRIDATSLIDGTRLSRIFRGEREPMQGWISPRAGTLAPTASFHVAVTGATARFATLFCLGGDLAIEDATFNGTLSAGQVRWRDASGRHALAFRREQEVVEARAWETAA
jgi:hypothetical protein